MNTLPKTTKQKTRAVTGITTKCIKCKEHKLRKGGKVKRTVSRQRFICKDCLGKGLIFNTR